MGIVLANDDDPNISNAQQANALMNMLWKTLSTSYVANNAAAGYGTFTDFEEHPFGSVDEMNKWVLNPDHAEEALCFGLSWGTFDETTNTYDLQVRYGIDFQIPTTVGNQ